VWYAADDQKNPKSKSWLRSVGVASARVFAGQTVAGEGFTAPSTACGSGAGSGEQRTPHPLPIGRRT